MINSGLPLYDLLDFSELAEDQDMAALKKYLEEAAANFSKTKTFNDSLIRPPQIETGYANLVFVSGLPKAPAEKVEMIRALILTKILPIFNLQNNLVDREVELNAEGTATTGNAILLFDTPESARIAQEGMDNLELGKIKLNAILFDVLDDILTTPNDLKPTFHKQDDELLYFLDDADFREQLAIRKCTREAITTTNEVHLVWNNDIEGNIAKEAIISDETVPSNDFLCEKIEFSNTGKYLVSFTGNGVDLYGGRELRLLASYKHSKACEIKFSPDDSYMATFSGIASDKGKSSENMVIWEVRTGIKLKVFNCPKKSVFDLFAWSFDESLCATIVETKENPLLYVYTSANMDLLPEEVEEAGKTVQKKRPLQVAFPKNVMWANKRNTLIYACYPEGEEQGKALLGCIDLPSRVEYRWTDITFKILSTQIKWEDNDRWVSVYLHSQLKKDSEFILQVGTLPKPSPNKALKNLMQVKNLSFKEKEREKVKDFGFDKSGRNFFITSSNKLNKTTFEYFGITLDRVVSIDREFATTDPFDYETVLFSNIDNICVFHTRGEVAFVQLPNKTEKFKLKQTGIIKKISVGSFLEFDYDNSGRNLMIFDKSTQRVGVYSAYGQEKMVKDLSSTQQCRWRKIKKVSVEEAVVKELQKELTQERIQRFEREDAEKVKRYNEEFTLEKRVKMREFMKFFEEGQRVWEETRDQRFELLGRDEDVIDEPVWLECVDKEEEYDCIVLPR